MIYLKVHGQGPHALDEEKTYNLYSVCIQKKCHLYLFYLCFFNTFCSYRACTLSDFAECRSRLQRFSKKYFIL